MLGYTLSYSYFRDENIIFPEMFTCCQNKHFGIWENVGGQKYEIILSICCKFEGEVIDQPILID